MSAFIAPLLAVPLALALAGRHPVEVPKGFGLWVLFLLWVCVSATQLSDVRDWAAFGYRFSGYVGGTVLFLYVLNAPRDLLPTSAVVKIMAGFWVMVAVGGLVGTFLPAFSFTTLTEALLPRALLGDTFVYDMVHASTSSLRAFAAYPIYRPRAPFAYTNLWGASYAISLPFAIASLATIRRRLWSSSLVVLLVASVAPLVFSLARGAWLSIGAAAVYALLRMVGGWRGRALVGVLLALLVLAGLVAFTPLGEIVSVRLGAGYGDKDRLYLYSQSIELAQASPVFGYGAPVDVHGLPSAGTHGQFWTVLVSHGVPGTLLFIGWLGWACYRSGRNLWRTEARPNVRLWTHLAMFIALVQLPFYQLLPWGLLVTMVAAALFWREARIDGVVPPQAVRPSPGRSLVTSAAPRSGRG